MKKVKPLLVLAFLILTIIAKAQDVKHQSEIITNNVVKGDYKIIADLYKSHSGVMKITDIKIDKSKPNGHYEIILKQYPNHARESTRNETIHLFADNLAFPVTYIKSTYEADEKLRKAVGYVVRTGPSVGSDRVVFVDNYIFILQNWKNYEDFQIRYILKSEKSVGNKTETKKKKKSLLKSFKSKFKKGQSLEKLYLEILKPYLEKATEKQKTYYAQWIKKPKNAKTKKYIDDKRIMMDNAIKKYNDDIFNSPEYQRMLAYNKWYNANQSLTVKNNKNYTIYVSASVNNAINTKISSGSSSSSVSCGADLYYFSSESQSSGGVKFYSAESACGKTVTVN